MFGYIVLLFLVAVFAIVVVMNVRIVPQAHAYVIERLGGYLKTWSVGIHIKIPL